MFSALFVVLYSVLNILSKSIVVCLVLYIILSLVFVIYFKLKIEPVNEICKSNARLDDKIVLVTGGNQGIGLETAREIAARGAKVVIACRNEKKSAEAIADIVNTTGNKNIEYKYLDLSSFKCIRQFAEYFNQTFDRLDILVNNAGCATFNSKVTEDGIDLVMQVNYLGPFLLTNLLMAKIQASPDSRIINLTSFLSIFGRVTLKDLKGLHTYPYLKYQNSKLCVNIWTVALAKRLPRNVTVNCVHPGYVKTDIFKNFNFLIRRWNILLIDMFKFKTPKEGAQTSLYLAVSKEVANVSGKYFTGCKEAEFPKTAPNDELVEKIWEKSVMLTS